jgi:hypothetical protein
MFPAVAKAQDKMGFSMRKPREEVFFNVRGYPFQSRASLAALQMSPERQTFVTQLAQRNGKGFVARLGRFARRDSLKAYPLR